MRYVPPKRRFTQYLHGDTSQKTVFFSHRRKNLKSYKRASVSKLAECVSDILKITATIMAQSFKKFCMTNEFDDTEDGL
jgi:hypothetical protein